MWGLALSFLSKYKVLLNPTVILVAVVASATLIGYRHINNLSDTVIQLNAELVLSNLAFESKQGELLAKNTEIQRLRKSMEFSNSIRAHLDLELKKSNFTYLHAKKVFDEHDFRLLLETKPNLMSDRMRDGTDRVFTLIEEAANK